MKALFVDNDVHLLDVMTYALGRDGYRVTTAIDGRQALHEWATKQPHIVLLASTLPKLDGFEVCRQIRHQAKTPVIMLTARDEADILRGLQMGADDCVTMPFSVKVLAARMGAVLRRCRAQAEHQTVPEVHVGDLVLNLEVQEVTKAGQPVQLTRPQFRILYILATNEGRVVPYSRLIEYAWCYYNEVSSGLLKTHVTHLRQTLGLPTAGVGCIKAVPGVGYRLGDIAWR